MNEKIILQVDEEEAGDRLDAFIASRVESLSRQHVQSLIKESRVEVNGRRAKSSLRLKESDAVQIVLPEAAVLKVEAQEIPLNVVYEDSHLLVIDKTANMVVHPAPGHRNGTLVNALLHHVTDLSGINGTLRPGIVHRLDKDTSGLLVVAKSDAAHRGLAEQILEHSFNREYVTLVHGIIQEDLGLIDAPIGRSPSDRKKMAVVPGGKNAQSEYTVLKRFGQYSLVNVKLLTGRTHQIRVHMAYIKHPVVGDGVYGSGRNPFGLQRQFLHARLLGFVHPVTGEYMELVSELPPELQLIVQQLEQRV